MPVLLTVLFCGLLGAIVTVASVVASNLFVHGYTFLSGYEATADPIVFGAMGLAWGLLAGGGGVIWARIRGRGQALATGLGVTLAGIVVVAGGVTAKRHEALPRVPMIDGKELWLQFELRLPADYARPNLPTRGEFRTTGQGFDISGVVLDEDRKETRDGRIVLPGSAPLLRAVRERRLEVFDGNVPWPGFYLSLPAYPTKADMNWTDWFPTDGSAADARLRAHGYQIRYRVRPRDDREEQ